MRTMSERRILAQIEAYKRRYFLNHLVRGVLRWLLLVGLYLLVALAVEYRFRCPSVIRGGLYFGFFATLVLYGALWVFPPLCKLLLARRYLSHHEASRRIGKHMPEIGERLLNWVEILSMQKRGGGALLTASLNRRTPFLEKISFARAVRLGENKKHLLFLSPLLLLGFLMAVFFSEPLGETSERIVHYQKTYAPPAPFFFVIQNPSLETFANEPFQLVVSLTGRKIPEKVYVSAGLQRGMLTKESATCFTYTLRPFAKDMPFRLYGDGHESPLYLLSVREKPSISQSVLHLEYPPHTRRKDEHFNILKNLFVPEGTRINWQLKTTAVEAVYFNFDSEKTSHRAKKQQVQAFSFGKRFLATDRYTIRLEGESLKREDEQALQYGVHVAKDEPPSLSLEVFSDSLRYDFVILAGQATDDYGIARLQLQYKGANMEKEATLSIPIANKGGPIQPFYFEWTVPAAAGDTMQYCVAAWDKRLCEREQKNTQCLVFSSCAFRRGTGRAAHRERRQHERATHRKLNACPHAPGRPKADPRCVEKLKSDDLGR